MWILDCLIVFVCVRNAWTVQEVISIGGVFEQQDSNLMKAFGFAVDTVNANISLLANLKLRAQIKQIDAQNSFNAYKEVCALLKSGVAAIFGPQSSYISPLMDSLLQKFDIPHIETRWDFSRTDGSYSINVFPYWESLAKAYKDAVIAMGWKAFTILYEDDEALIRLQYLLQLSSSDESSVSLRKLKPEYRLVLKELKKHSVTRIVLDCRTENIKPILAQARQVGIMSDYHSYILTNLDLHTVDLTDSHYAQTNITGFRLVDPDNFLVKKIEGDLSYRENVQKGKVVRTVINTQSGLIFDAVTLFAHALQDHYRSDPSESVNVDSISCENGRPWSHGKSLIRAMKQTTVQGLTGTVAFDSRQSRSNVKIDIIELKKAGLVKSGEWSIQSGINYTRDEEAQLKEYQDSLKNKTLKITTIIKTPYTMLKENRESIVGNNKFEGYCVDLIKKIAERLEFNFEIKVAKEYGKMDPETGEWNGMIGELLSGEADLAMGDLTITYERDQAVDFTMPFMNLGISILFKKPDNRDPGLFSFLSPLSWDVWLYMITAYLGVSIFMFIVARFSPYEWQSPHPCDQEIDILENQFTLMNSLWFTIGSLMQQGSDLAPKAWSTRMVAGTWWFFTLIMISSYTANLAAFLTVQRMVSPIESAEDLARQTRIKYGCFGGGSTEAFFRNSKMGTFQRMWSFMESARPSVFVKAGAGVERVLKGNYAYLMESTSIEYETQRNCQLTQVGGWLDSKGYGFAAPPGSPYRQLISSEILKLQEETILDVLKIKWWKNSLQKDHQCGDEDKKKKSSGSANELSLANVGGVFVVLLVGIGLSCIIGIFEFIWKTRRRAEDEKEPLCTEMLRELRFAVTCQSSRRPTKKRDNLSQAEENFVTFPGFSSITSKEPLA